MPAEFTGADYPPAAETEGDPATYAGFTGALETLEPLAQVEGIAVAPDGTIYAVDSGNNRIAVFNGDGSFREFWGAPGSGDGQFTFHDPQQGWHLGDIDVAEDGTVYVLDPGNMRIQTFDPSGAFLASLGPAPGDPGTMNVPDGMGLDEVNDRIFVASLEDTAVHVYDLEGNYLESWGPGGAGDSERFMDPSDVAVGSEGSIYISEHGRSKIRIYSPEGQPIATWGGLGSDPGRLVGPWGIAVDADDNILVADYVGDTIVTYAPDGKVIGVSGGDADADDYLGWPAFVAAGPNGTIYVAEEGGSEISIYAVGGAPAVAASPEASPVASPEA
jgi:sugar lactone lactonase YvrE